MKFDCIIWDWNGTLIDDLGVAISAVNDIMTQYDLPHIDRQKYYECMDSDIRGFYAHLVDYDKVSFEEISHLFSRGYDKYVVGTTLMPGAKEALAAVHESGIKQVIVSASRQDKIERDAGRFGILEYFDEILGASDLLVGSKVSRAVDFIARCGISNERVLVIGDLLHDLEMAQAIPAECVLIPNGHQSREQLEGKGAHILEDISLVPDFTKQKGSDSPAFS